jgi:hypothetical protein
MRLFLKIILLLFSILSTSCNKSEVDLDLLSQSSLITCWESQEPTYFMLENHYCDAFRLNEDGTFAIYYVSGGKPDFSRVDGTWTLEDPNKLIFDFSSDGLPPAKVEIISYTEEAMTIKESGDITFQLKRDG